MIYAQPQNLLQSTPSFTLPIAREMTMHDLQRMQVAAGSRRFVSVHLSTSGLMRVSRRVHV